MNYTSIANAGTVITFNQVINGVTEAFYVLTGNTDGYFRVELPTVDAANAATGQFMAPFFTSQRIDYAVTLSDAGTIDIALIIASAG